MLLLANSLRRTAQRAFRRLPTDLRKPSDTAVSSLRYTLAQWRQQAFRVNGWLLAGGERGTLIYFGQLPQYKTWIANLFLKADPPESIGWFSLPDIAKRRGALTDSNAILCPINPLSQMLFPAQSWFIVPKYIDCLIDLRRPIKQLVHRHSAKDDLRIVRKHNYRFDIRRDDAAFDEFYNEMLVPTAMTRHEERAHISSPAQLRRVFHDGYLLAIYRGDEWLGANLVVPGSCGMVKWANIGWRDGSEQLMKDRVVSALLHEMIVRTQADGFESLHLGGCAPFVNDGPLSFKLKWGARLAAPRVAYEGDQLQGINAFLAVHYNLRSPAGRSFLERAPILDLYDKKLRAVGWQSALRSDFRPQIDRGMPWVDLSLDHRAENTPNAS